MQLTRRSFLRGAGALVVTFAGTGLPRMPAVQASGDTRSPVDPKRLDSWLAVHPDGTVTAYTGKCDLGQGISTAQVQLVAEELCVELSRVSLVQCDTALTPDQGSTSGSQSTPTNFNEENLALAAATAREALLRLAAERWQEPAEHLRAKGGVIASVSGRKITYGELVGGRHFELVLDRKATRRPRSEWTVLGKAIPAIDHPALMTAQFEYVQHVRLPGMVHGRVVRPPRFGASLLRVDAQSVEAIPGVVKVVVRKDFVGVVAETQYAAIQAARQLKAEWTSVAPLPSATTFFQHLKEQPSHDALDVDSGDTAGHLSAAEKVVSARYTYPFQSHGSLGTSCAVADVRKNSATVWSATQSVYPTRDCLALLLGLGQESVRVIFTRGSGCYGLNGADAVSFEAAVLSQVAGRPVRLQYSREDEMAWENYGNACLVEHKAGLDATGKIVVWERESWIPSLGSRPGNDRPGNVIAGRLLGYEAEPLEAGSAAEPAGKLRNGSNTVPGYMAGCAGGACAGGGTIRSERVLTHTVAAPFFTGPLRSPLRIQNTFANECFMDELSFHAGSDPLQFRLKHLEDARLRGVLDAVAKAVSWPIPRATPSQRPEGVVRGFGVACVAYEGKNGYAALIAEVDIDTRSGLVHPRRFTIAIDCGPISNPDGLRNQVEGGLLQGTSRSLVEEVTWDEHRITSSDWETYGSLRLDYEVPEIETIFVEPPGVPATGAGETSITVTPAAIGNAIFNATGARLRDVPFTPARVKAALQAGAQSYNKGHDA